MGVRIGIDAGSKTVKVVVADEQGKILRSSYRRHLANIKTTLVHVLRDMVDEGGDAFGPVAITGSAGLSLAKALGIPHVQEVVATTRAVRRAFPQADAFIELGGEDAKIVYLSDAFEQRMNATCAGGTGGFIDTMAGMLGVRASDMNRLASRATRLYPIASRCAVFAQTDVRPLLNSGADPCDVAASVLDAVARQTLGGLACGRPLRGTVVMLGGPLEHITALVELFRARLGLDETMGVKPPNAHLLTACGAALSASSEDRLFSLSELAEECSRIRLDDDGLARLAPLFADAREIRSFKSRHARLRWPRIPLSRCEGPLFLGIDAGSTSVKLVVLDEGGALAHSEYRPARGDAYAIASAMLSRLLRELPARAWIARAAATGYGEDLMRAAFGVDDGVVETLAHAEAACALRPDVSFVLDIGGQDIKALWIRDGRVADAVLNEACSSGCGAFLEGTAYALGSTPDALAEAALASRSPVDLGTKCTVFMTSRVRHAQKIGASLADLGAGLACSVVQNALYRIIGPRRLPREGACVMVQGGAFKSDAVLRVFEAVSGCEALRPDTAHLMGAIGAALAAQRRWHALREANGGEGVPSSLVDAERLRRLAPVRTSLRCGGCGNACELSVVEFSEGCRVVSGNRCARGAEMATGVRPARRECVPPDCARLEQRLVAACSSGSSPARSGGGAPSADGDAAAPEASGADSVSSPRLERVSSAGARPASGGAASPPGSDRAASVGRVRVGIVGALAGYEALPYWSALLRELGCEPVAPQRLSDERARSAALESIPSESVCYPAKQAHAQLFSLAQEGVAAAIMPRCERGSRCPVLCGYAGVLEIGAKVSAGAGTLVLQSSVAGIPLISPLLASSRPWRGSWSKEARDDLLKGLRSAAGGLLPFDDDALSRALATAEEVQCAFERALSDGAIAALRWLAADRSRRGVVLCCRSYHIDPDVLHGVNEVLRGLGFAVLTASALNAACRLAPDDTLVAPLLAAVQRARWGWQPAKRLVRLARIVADHPQLNAVFLRSFGCVMDAAALEETRGVLDAAGKPFTVVKIDDIVDTAHVDIRLRTLAQTIRLDDPERFSAQGGVAARARKAGTAVEGILGTWAEPSRSGAESSVAAAESSDVGAEPEATSGLAPARVVDVLAEPICWDDVEIARRDVPADLCFTAAILCARALRCARAFPLETLVLSVPKVCCDCVLDALPSIVERACGDRVRVEWCASWPRPLPDLPESGQADGGAMGASGRASSPLVGILGNPLLCFEPALNAAAARILAGCGCRPIIADDPCLFADDVRYLPQLDRWYADGIRDVVYLLSFGCLKGHVSVRGALRSLSLRYPRMRITVIDCDAEASDLNRENRLRLAAAAAIEALRDVADD